MNFLKGLFGNDEPIKTYDDFWTWFKSHEQSFFNVVKQGRNIEKNFFDKLSPKLAEIKDGYFYLTGMFDENTVELILTADGTIKNLVFVEELVSSAPSIPGWRFTAHKPEMDIKDTNIKMGKYSFDSDNLWFYSNNDPKYPDEIDVTIVYRDYNEQDKSSIINGVYIFLDNYLGELKSVTMIDSCKIIGKPETKHELIPIEKIKGFLDWREKEFIEKYEGIALDTHNMEHSILEARRESGARLIAAINTEILNWESKASHPWILSIKVPYDDASNHGLPDGETNKSLEDLEAKISEQLKSEEGNILIGHESADHIRSIYFACKDFRKPIKVSHQISIANPELKITYDIYKDKYWQSFNRFNPLQAN